MDHISKKAVDLIIPYCTPGILWVKEGKFIRKHKSGFDEFNKGDIILFGQKTPSATYEMEDVHVDAVGFKLTSYSSFNSSVVIFSAHGKKSTSIEQISDVGVIDIRNCTLACISF